MGRIGTRKYSDTVGNDPLHRLAPRLLQIPLLITLAVRKHQANSTNECLINTARCGRGRQKTFSLVILSLYFSVPLYLSPSLSLFYLFSLSVFSPSHSLKTDENKGRDRRTAIQPLGPDLRSTPVHVWPQHSFACPLKALVSL